MVLTRNNIRDMNTPEEDANSNNSSEGLGAEDSRRELFNRREGGVSDL
jgi:hypothetical protein